MRVAMIGATGLIGRQLAPLLAARHQLILFNRRPAGIAGARETVAPLDQWPGLIAGEAVDVAISTLGTTWRKAGNWPAFEAIDRLAVVAFARAAREASARQMICVSSVGADPASRQGYLALKGRAEEDLAAIGFERLDIIRPGLLRGPRAADRRLGERLGILLSPLVNPFLRARLDRFAAIDGAVVAQAIAALVGAEAEGNLVHTNRELHRLAKS